MIKLSRRDALSIIALAYPMGVSMGTDGRLHRYAWLNPDQLHRLLPSLGTQSQDLLLQVLNDSNRRGLIPGSEVESILRWEHKPLDELMVDLLPIAQLHSYSPLSNYRVGVLVHGNSGALYLGTNIEVPHQTLGFAVHGEQCAVTNAFMHDESGLTSLAVTAAPCGHCRQFLNELPNAGNLKVLVKGSKPTTLAQLLPQSFGPDNLGVSERLFTGKKADLEFTSAVTDELSLAALEATRKSFAPYTKSLSGIALRSSTKAIYQGSYIENAAYNPSLSPLQAALVGLIMAGESPNHVLSVALVELKNAPISQASVTRAVLDSIAPSAEFKRVTARLTLP